MTRDEIPNLPAGRELDALIAIEVMGWHKEVRDGFDHWIENESGRFMCGVGKYSGHEDDEDFHILNWHPSESMLWAWEVVEKMQSNGYCFDADGNALRRRIRFGIGQEIAEAKTMPLAICRAALLAVNWQELPK